MAKRYDKNLFWWKMVLVCVLVGLGYAGIVSYNWERLVQLGSRGQQKEYTDNDLMQCEPGTHQENGRCVSNPSRPQAAASAPAPTAAPKSAQPVKK